MNRFRRVLLRDRTQSSNDGPKKDDQHRRKRFSLFHRSSAHSVRESVMMDNGSQSSHQRSMQRQDDADSLQQSNLSSTRNSSRAYSTPTSAFGLGDERASFSYPESNPSMSVPASFSAHVATTIADPLESPGLGIRRTPGPWPPSGGDSSGSVSTSQLNDSGAFDETTLSPSDTYLQLGMQYHEQGELEKATYYWGLSAENESPLGLFFYGIALRHGWGCKKNPAIAVRHLQKAAQCAVYDLQTGIAKSTTVAKSELVLAIYELGVCFRHGWGVPKNWSTASYYFEIAANLGDPDAQNDLAFCYAHGYGVKKDIAKAAKYYRMADRQGQGIVGNSWIWKEKYGACDVE